MVAMSWYCDGSIYSFIKKNPFKFFYNCNETVKPAPPVFISINYKHSNKSGKCDLWWLPTAIAVSYTHLDVYKRQI